MVDGHCSAQHMMVERVQLIDLENTAPIFLKAGRWIKGMLAGNDNWRSPEAHLKGGGLTNLRTCFPLESSWELSLIVLGGIYH